jgi:hypothetical protein
VDLAVGDHHNASETLARHFGELAAKRGEKTGAIVAGAGLRLPGTHHADIEVMIFGKPRAHGG